MDGATVDLDTFGSHKPRLGSRTPEREAKVRLYLTAALSGYLPIAMLTRTADDDRIVLGLLQMVNDPAEWDKWADLIFGPKVPND